MGGEIAYTFRGSGLGIDRTTKSGDGLFRFAAISQFGYAPNDLLFICPLPRRIFIPPENPNVRNSFAFELIQSPLRFRSVVDPVRDLPIRDAFGLVL
jgi:hypothetical protein